MSPILLDTCAAIWLGAEEPVAPAAVEALQSQWEEGESVRLSPITAWELGLLVSKGRLAITGDPTRWFDDLVRRSSARLIALEPSELVAASFLPGSPPKDAADRILAATARRFGLRLMTRDTNLLAYAEAGHIQALAC